MSDSARLRTSAVLKALRDSLSPLPSNCEEVYFAVKQEVRRTLDELRQRERYWSHEVEHRQRYLQEMELMLRRCRATASSSGSQRQQNSDPCSQIAASLIEARVQLERAQVGLRDTRSFIEFVSASETAFLKSEYQFRTWCTQQIPKAQNELQRLASLADSYAPSGGINTGGTAPPPPLVPTAAEVFSKDGNKIHNVPISQINWQAAHVRGAEDFRHGVTLDEMTDGIRNLSDFVRPNVEAGRTREFFQQVDEEQGLHGNTCYTNILDSFYGEGPGGYIKLTRQGDRYEVNWGYHRLYAANLVGISHVPAVVVDLNESNFPAEFREGNSGGSERRK